jgi:hypothetical protein
MDDMGWLIIDRKAYNSLTNGDALVKLVGRLIDDKELDDAGLGARLRILYHGYKIAEEANKHVNARI